MNVMVKMAIKYPVEDDDMSIMLRIDKVIVIIIVHNDAKANNRNKPKYSSFGFPNPIIK